MIMRHCWHDKEGVHLPGVGEGAKVASGTGGGEATSTLHGHLEMLPQSCEVLKS